MQIWTYVLWTFIWSWSCEIVCEVLMCVCVCVPVVWSLRWWSASSSSCCCASLHPSWSGFSSSGFWRSEPSVSSAPRAFKLFFDLVTLCSKQLWHHQLINAISDIFCPIQIWETMCKRTYFLTGTKCCY